MSPESVADDKASGAIVLAARWLGTVPDELLYPPELREMRRLPAWKQRDWSASRLTARAAITVLTSGERSGPILPGSDGLPTADGVELSLSHSHSWVAAAVARAGVAIGVDVQQPDEGIEPLIPRVSNQAEEPLASPIRHWCLKDAAFKATRGEGTLRRYLVRDGDPATIALLGTELVLSGWTRTIQRDGVDGEAVVAVAGPPSLIPRFIVAESTTVVSLLRTASRS